MIVFYLIIFSCNSKKNCTKIIDKSKVLKNITYEPDTLKIDTIYGYNKEIKLIEKKADACQVFKFKYNSGSNGQLLCFGNGTFIYGQLDEENLKDGGWRLYENGKYTYYLSYKHGNLEMISARKGKKTYPLFISHPVY